MRHRERGEFAEAQSTTVGTDHRAFFGATSRCGYAPGGGRRRDERCPRRCTGFAHRHPAVAHTRRSTGHHDAQLTRGLGHHPANPAHQRAVGFGGERQPLHQCRHIAVDLIDRAVLHPHARPIALELFRQEHRQRGVRALSHLGFGHHHGDRVVGGDGEPAVERDGRAAGIGTRAPDEPLARGEQRPAQKQRTSGTQPSQ